MTQLLSAWSRGDEDALNRLVPLVYDELRKLARAYLSRERPDHTLQPTALVNEAYLRLVDQTVPVLKNRSHFFGIAARLMRRILVEHARSRGAAKRGAGGAKISLDEIATLAGRDDSAIIEMDEALNQLEASDPRKARMIELRYFGGMTVEEIAETEGVSVATVGRGLRFAEAWLRRAMR